MRLILLVFPLFFGGLVLRGASVDDYPLSISEKLRGISKLVTKTLETNRYEKALDFIRGANDVFSLEERDDVRVLLLEVACLLANGDRTAAKELLSQKTERGFSSTEWESAYTGIAVEMMVGMMQENLPDSRLEVLLETILQGYVEVEIRPLRAEKQKTSCLQGRIIRLKNAHNEFFLYPRFVERNVSYLPQLLPPGDYNLALISDSMVFERGVIHLKPWSHLAITERDFSLSQEERDNLRKKKLGEVRFSITTPQEGEVVSLSTNSVFQWTGSPSTDSGLQLTLARIENGFEHHVVWGPVSIGGNSIPFPPETSDNRELFLPGTYNLFIGTPMKNNKEVIQGDGVVFEIVP